MLDDRIGSKARHERARRASPLLLLALVALTACAGTSSGASGSSTSSAACGTVPTVRPTDSSGQLAKLPVIVTSGYNGADARILSSAWSGWKPKHSPPYTVGISYGALTNPFQTGFFNALQQDLKQSSLVKSVVAYSIPGPTD